GVDGGDDQCSIQRGARTRDRLPRDRETGGFRGSRLCGLSRASLLLRARAGPRGVYRRRACPLELPAGESILYSRPETSFLMRSEISTMETWKSLDICMWRGKCKEAASAPLTNFE